MRRVTSLIAKYLIQRHNTESGTDSVILRASDKIVITVKRATQPSNVKRFTHLFCHSYLVLPEPVGISGLPFGGDPTIGFRSLQTCSLNWDPWPHLLLWLSSPQHTGTGGLFFFNFIWLSLGCRCGLTAVDTLVLNPPVRVGALSPFHDAGVSVVFHRLVSIVVGNPWPWNTWTLP